MSHRRTCTLFAPLLALSLFVFASTALAQQAPALATQAAPQTAPSPVVSGSPAPARIAGAAKTDPSTASAEARGVPPEVQEMTELRNRLWREVMSQYPPSVGRDLQLSPLLLSDDNFLARYPLLEAFLKEHPDVRMNQRYFFPAVPQEERSGASGVAAGMLIGTVVPLAFFALLFGAAYLFHQRSRAAIQARQETTAKLIDGLLAREDLVSHLDTPAGRRIIDSLNQRPEPAPASRIIRSVQAGIVLTFLGAGFGALRLLLALDADGRTGFATAATVLATIGLGLLTSAGVSYLLSKRFGLIETPGTRD